MNEEIIHAEFSSPKSCNDIKTMLTIAIGVNTKREKNIFLISDLVDNHFFILPEF